MIPFTRMHGAGNDFVCLDAISDPSLARRQDLAALAVAMSDRRSGVAGAGGTGRRGADGLIVICPPEPKRGPAPAGTVRMRMFNADGSESAMCGNGLRCVVKYVVDRGLVRAGAGGTVAVQTAAGLKEASVRLDQRSGTVAAVTVDMGPPETDPPRIPLDRRYLRGHGPEYELSLDDSALRASFVSMGNPHAVIYVPDVAAVDVAGLGPRIERHAAFPQRSNVHFVQVHGPAEVTMRTWERGCGMTLACGSGACAVCVVGVLTGRTGRVLLAHLPGGDLELRFEPSGNVLMTGPAVEEFGGRWGSAAARGEPVSTGTAP
jgi:diaminopimelate epimerase